MKLIRKVFALVIVLVLGLVVTGCKDDPVITINKKLVVLEVGESEMIIASAKPETKLVWESENPEIASVDASGKITGVAVGNTNVNVKAGKTQEKISVTVNPKVENVTVTFDSKGGSSIASVTLEKGAKVTKPQDPTKAGYSFLGWYLVGALYDFDLPVNANMTLEAKWEEIQQGHKVTFDSKGGSTIAPVYVADGELLIKPEDPEKEGYAFLGWYLGDVEYDFGLAVTGPMTLVAKWKDDTKAIVTFETFGGTQVQSQTVNKGSKALRPLVYPEKEGYTFVDWYSDEALEVVADFNLAINKDTTFYAKYRAQTNIPYIVEHRQLISGTYKLKDTETLFGSTGVVATYEAKEYQYHELKVFPEDQYIKADGSTVVVLNYDQIDAYNYTLVFNGGNSIYRTRDDLVTDFLADFNAYRQSIGSSPVTLAEIDGWGAWSPLDMHTFMYSSYRTKWLWLADYLGQVGSNANAPSCRAVVRYETLAQFQANTSANSAPYAVEYEFRAFVLGKQFTKNANYLSSDYSQFALGNGYGPKLAEYRMQSSFNGVMERIFLPTDLYREGFNLAGWFDNPEFTGQRVTNITSGGTYYARWMMSNAITEIVINNPVETLTKGQTHQLTWTVLPEDAPFKNVIITTSDPVVAKVTQEGLISAENYGSATIRITAGVDSTMYTEFTVNIPAEDALSAELSAGYNGTLKVGESFTITPQVYGSLALADTTYETSDASIASVANGVVTAVALGDVTVTVKNKAHEFTIALSVIEKLSDTELVDKALALLIQGHQPVLRGMNTILLYDPGKAGILYDARYENVNRYLFDKFVVENTYLLDPATHTAHSGPMSSVEFVTVHDTANPNGGVDAHGAYFRNTNNVSIHYCVGDGRIISSLPEGYRAWHAGDGTGTQFKWLDTTITGTGTPVIDINGQGYYTINGQATPLEAPRGRSGEVLDKSYFGDLGPAWKLEGGKYYLGNTRFSTSQTARGVISNYGGNNNSIGIEMCVNTSGNIIDTWQRNAKLVADILTRHNLDTNRVKMHNTFDGKNCPSSLRQTHYWAEFMEMVEIEYAFMNEFKDVEVTMVSNTPELLTNLGGIKAKPKNTSTVSYTITVKKGDVTKSVTLSSIVPGTTTWAQLNGFY